MAVDLKKIAELMKKGWSWEGLNGSSGSSSSSVQPNWNQSDPNAPDYVKNRTHYADAEVFVDNVTVQIRELNGQFGAQLCEPLNPAPKSGDVLRFILNGEEYDLVSDGNGRFLLENDSWLIMFDLASGVVMSIAEMDITVSVEKPFVKKLDNKYIDDIVPRYGEIGDLIQIEWDGSTEGRDNFVCNGFMYYKVGEIAPKPEHLSNITVYDTYQDFPVTEMAYGTNCYNGLYWIAVTTEGQCKTSEGMEFTSPSSGIYSIKHDYTVGTIWCKRFELDTRRKNSILYLMNPLGVKYAITVDDSGTLTATEVVE